MAVRILKEFQWTQDFDDQLDKAVDDLSDEFNKKTQKIRDKYAQQRKDLYDKSFDKYKNKNFDIVTIKNNRGEEIYIIDKVTARVAFNRINKYLTNQGFKVNKGYEDNQNEIIKVIKTTIKKKYKDDKIQETHNGGLTAHKYVEMELRSFSDNSGYKPGIYKCPIDINVFCRSGLKELSEKGSESKRKNNTELFEFLIISNINKYPKKETPDSIKEIYKEVIDLIHKTILQTNTEQYWDIKEIEESVQPGDIKLVTK